MSDRCRAPRTCPRLHPSPRSTSTSRRRVRPRRRALADDGHTRDPAVVKQLVCPCALLGVQSQHGPEEGCDAYRGRPREHVLVVEHVLERPEAELGDVPQLAAAVEEFGGVLAGGCDRLGEVADELDDLGDVVVVLRVPVSARRVKEVVAAGEQLEDLQR